MTLQDKLAMGHYAQTVWTAYGVAILVLAINLFLPYRETKKQKKARRRSGATR